MDLLVREGSANRVLLASSQTAQCQVFATDVLLVVLARMALAQFAQMVDHQMQTAQPVDHASEDTLAREGPAIAVTPVLGQQVQALSVSRVPLAPSVLMVPVHGVLRAPSRTVQAVLVTHVVLTPPAPVALAHSVR